MTERILNLKVGEPLETELRRTADAMKALDRGETPEPYFSVGFNDVSQLFSVFTSRRWDLLATLRASGPVSIAELARLARRDYKNVYQDVLKLTEWLAVEKDEKGRVFTPYAEIRVDVRLPEGRAA